MKPEKYYVAGGLLLVLLIAGCPGKHRQPATPTGSLDTPRVTAPAAITRDSLVARRDRDTSTESVYFKVTGNEP